MDRLDNNITVARYKKSTDAFICWLLSKMSAVVPRFKPSGPVIALPELLEYARTVATCKRDGLIDGSVLRNLRDCIKDRKDCAAKYAELAARYPDPDLEHENATHQHFIDVLQTISTLLQTRFKDDTITLMQKVKMTQPSNAFAALPVHESSETDDTALPETTPSPPSKEPEPVKVEVKGAECPLLDGMMLIDRLAQHRTFIRATCEECARGEMSDLGAFVLTERALGLALGWLEELRDAGQVTTFSLSVMMQALGVESFMRAYGQVLRGEAESYEHPANILMVEGWAMAAHVMEANFEKMVQVLELQAQYGICEDRVVSPDQVRKAKAAGPPQYLPVDEDAKALRTKLVESLEEQITPRQPVSLSSDEERVMPLTAEVIQLICACGASPSSCPRAAYLYALGKLLQLPWWALDEEDANSEACQLDHIYRLFVDAFKNGELNLGLVFACQVLADMHKILGATKIELAVTNLQSFAASANTDIQYIRLTYGHFDAKGPATVDVLPDGELKLRRKYNDQRGLVMSNMQLITLPLLMGSIAYGVRCSQQIEVERYYNTDGLHIFMQALYRCVRLSNPHFRWPDLELIQAGFKQRSDQTTSSFKDIATALALELGVKRARIDAAHSSKITPSMPTRTSKFAIPNSSNASYRVLNEVGRDASYMTHACQLLVRHAEQGGQAISATAKKEIRENKEPSIEFLLHQGRHIWQAEEKHAFTDHVGMLSSVIRLVVDVKARTGGRIFKAPHNVTQDIWELVWALSRGLDQDLLGAVSRALATLVAERGRRYTDPGEAVQKTFTYSVVS